jgi:protein-S-isoprenylcysteine O-methyltransferase Ste14
MSLIPAFEIGLWNAWMLTLYEVLTIPFFFRIAKKRGTQSPTNALASLSRPKRLTFTASKIIYFPAMVYSIFLPLKLGTVWFYVGLPLTLVGLVTGTIVLVNWAKAPLDKPVTGGLYRYSRHPMYITSFFFFFGVSIATASWVFLVFTIVMIVSSLFSSRLEEQGCLEQYGDAYRDYMKRTPRWLSISKKVAG